MEKVKPICRKFVDWNKTGKKVQMLRENNLELRRQVCSSLKHDKANCMGECDVCEFEMDNHISRKELAEVFGETENVIYNWERGITDIKYEDLLFYAQLAKVELDDIVVFQS